MDKENLFEIISRIEIEVVSLIVVSLIYYTIRTGHYRQDRISANYSGGVLRPLHRTPTDVLDLS